MGHVTTDRAVVVGAGIGGLTAAVELARRGLDVTVVERAEAPGGKMREVQVGAHAVDAGPTVFTLRRVFESLFEDAGARLDDYLRTHRADVLARHAWRGSPRLDLFADEARSADAIAAFADATEAERYRAFCRHARRVFATLEDSFLHAPAPRMDTLFRTAGLQGMPDLLRMRPFASLWDVVADHFRDPRLRQLFARYATYCGADPFRATGTLALVAHVESEGVWLIDGGMARLAEALAALARAQGARVRYGAEVERIGVADGRATGVALAGGEWLPADVVVTNADAQALAAGLLGADAAPAVPATRPAERSLSAMTWSLVAEPEGFEPVRHNVFFCDDYRAEFRDIFRHHRTPRDPTIYVCAQDRDGTGASRADGPERFLCIVNAPPTGDRHRFTDAEIADCEQRAFGLMAECGLRLDGPAGQRVVTTPSDFERLFPGTGGALYGRAPHGWRASFERPGVRTAIPGLYLAGGSGHPGPGVPMVALSGRLAAAAAVADRAGRRR